jgi:hypothetical protein
MKRNILTLTALFFQTIVCFGQESILNTFSSENDAPKTCRMQVENKAIGLSNITSDTLTLQQFRESNKVTIKSIFGEEITSYKISYILPDGTDLVEKTVLNDQLSEELIRSVVASGTKKIVFSEVIGAIGNENIFIGYRSFYLN